MRASYLGGSPRPTSNGVFTGEQVAWESRSLRGAVLPSEAHMARHRLGVGDQRRADRVRGQGYAVARSASALSEKRLFCREPHVTCVARGPSESLSKRLLSGARVSSWARTAERTVSGLPRETWRAMRGQARGGARALNVCRYVDLTAPYIRPAVTAETRHTCSAKAVAKKLGLRRSATARAAPRRAAGVARRQCAQARRTGHAPARACSCRSTALRRHSRAQAAESASGLQRKPSVRDGPRAAGARERVRV